MTPSELSQLSDSRLLARRRGLASRVSDLERTLPGVLMSQGRQCSGPGCRCRRGELHGPYTYLAVYVDGRSRMMYVPGTIAEVTESHLQATRRNEALLAEIAQINLELLKRRALR
jgi:hypothetical protein